MKFFKNIVTKDCLTDSSDSTELNIKTLKYILLGNLAFYLSVLIFFYLKVGKGLPQPDTLNMLSPFPDFENGKPFPTNIFEYSYYWYTSHNGRLFTAFINSIFSILFSTKDSIPENFPSYFFKSGAVSLHILGCVNIFFSISFSVKNKLWAIIMTFFATLSIFIYAPVAASLINFDTLLADRSIYIYLISLILLSHQFKLINNRYRYGLYFVVLFFLQVEQFLITLPILFFTYWFLFQEDKRALTIIKGWFFHVLCWVASYLVYTLSPGQKLRSLHFTEPNYNWSNKKDWYRYVSDLGMQTIYPMDGRYARKTISTLFYLMLLILLFYFFQTRKKENSNDALKKLFQLKTVRCASIAIAFILSYYASLLSFFVAPYFPQYAIQYPSLLLFAGMMASLIALYYFIKESILSQKMELLEKFKLNSEKFKMAFNVIFLLWVGVNFYKNQFYHNFKKVEAIASDMRKTDEVRKLIYKGIVNEYIKGERKLYFYNIYRPAFSDIFGPNVNTIEAPWGIDSYRRWVKMNDLDVVFNIHDYIINAKKGILYQYKKIDADKMVREMAPSLFE